MKSKLFVLFAFLCWVFPSIIALHNVLSGNIPFWYDPARDMLSALGNISKVTLIGPPSGIPGIFYGPYWIWWLSIGEVISKDPKIVDAFALTLPYLIGFPLLLLLFSKIFGKMTSVILWLLFFNAFQSYMIFIWNPNLAPLLFLLIIYLLVIHDYGRNNLASSIRVCCIGIITGIVLNIHISFSVGFTLGTILFLLGNEIYTFRRHFFTALKNSIYILVSFVVGIFIVYLPTIFFEMRHGFSQIHTLSQALSRAGGVVGVQGLSKEAIVYNFFVIFSSILQMPFFVTILLLGASLVMLLLLYIQKKRTFSSHQVKLSVLLIFITGSVLGIYLVAKNPIWPYHFVGGEVICLLFIALIISQLRFFRYILLCWVLFLMAFQIQGFNNSLHVNLLKTQSLFSEEHVVHVINNDAGNAPYTVYAYNSAIYSYEYSYLFQWIAHKKFSYDPGQIKRTGIIYLILPQGNEAMLSDFIHYHTPERLYTTAKIWQIPNGTKVLKRVSPAKTI